MAQTKDSSVIGHAMSWFSDSWAELKKVHTPTRDETIRSALAVLLMVLAFSFFLGLTDLFVGKIMKIILT